MINLIFALLLLVFEMALLGLLALIFVDRLQSLFAHLSGESTTDAMACAYAEQLGGSYRRVVSRRDELESQAAQRPELRPMLDVCNNLVEHFRTEALILLDRPDQTIHTSRPLLKACDELTLLLESLGSPAPAAQAGDDPPAPGPAADEDPTLLEDDSMANASADEIHERSKLLQKEIDRLRNSPVVSEKLSEVLSQENDPDDGRAAPSA